ncbi:MAG: hypothetical protein JW759_03295, partial [Candidatus Coatesbacteria bacterium]|nr:hypothetical protein [Candidatus Coatesbacteria bacterium]
RKIAERKPPGGRWGKRDKGDEAVRTTAGQQVNGSKGGAPTRARKGEEAKEGKPSRFSVFSVSRW